MAINEHTILQYNPDGYTLEELHYWRQRVIRNNLRTETPTTFLSAGSGYGYGGKYRETRLGLIISGDRNQIIVTNNNFQKISNKRGPAIIHFVDNNHSKTKLRHYWINNKKLACNDIIIKMLNAKLARQK
jgi:hypothetical protein